MSDTSNGPRRPGERTARRVRVHGRVQGVFFRACCQDQARAAGVAGWVRNEPDGTVSAVFEGPQDSVEHLVAWCRDGSPDAEVRGVELTKVEPEHLEGFEVRR